MRQCRFVPIRSPAKQSLGCGAGWFGRRPAKFIARRSTQLAKTARSLRDKRQLHRQSLSDSHFPIAGTARRTPSVESRQHQASVPNLFHPSGFFVSTEGHIVTNAPVAHTFDHLEAVHSTCHSAWPNGERKKPPERGRGLSQQERRGLVRGLLSHREDGDARDYAAAFLCCRSTQSARSHQSAATSSSAAWVVGFVACAARSWASSASRR
jgi:hypothetical protein